MAGKLQSMQHWEKRYELCGGFPEEIKVSNVIKALEMRREGGRGRDPSPPKNSRVATEIYIDSNYLAPAILFPIFFSLPFFSTRTQGR